MPSKSRLMRHFEQEWHAAGQDPCVVMKQVRQLLRSYRELAWRASLDSQQANADSAELASGRALIDSLLGHEASVNAPQQNYGAAASLMRRTLAAVSAFPQNGPLYHAILEGVYFSDTPSGDSALWPELHIERSTYYQRKQEAIALFGTLIQK